MSLMTPETSKTQTRGPDAARHSLQRVGAGRIEVLDSVDFAATASGCVSAVANGARGKQAAHAQALQRNERCPRLTGKHSFNRCSRLIEFVNWGSSRICPVRVVQFGSGSHLGTVHVSYFRRLALGIIQ